MIAIRSLLISLAALMPVAAMAQQADTLHSDKVVTNARMIGVGRASTLDTYLSPEEYSGMELRYVSHTIRRREGRRLSHMLVHQGSFSYLDNRAGNGNEMSGMYTFSYGLHYNWDFLGGRLNVMAGGKVNASVGFLYNTRNGNNPAQARVGIDIAPSAAASYRFRLWNVPLAARYEVSAPLVGLMFSPNYGQSYYEIFSRGDYDHNIVPTTFVNAPSLSQMLTVDITLGRTSLRLGYLGDFRQAKVNNLKYHTYSNMFVIGFVRRFKLTSIIP